LGVRLLIGVVLLVALLSGSLLIRVRVTLLIARLLVAGVGVGVGEGAVGTMPALSAVSVVLKGGNVTLPPTSGIAKLNW